MSDEKRVLWTSHPLQKRSSDAEPLAVTYGGHPRGVRADTWPRCEVCAAPMCHMAQIHAGPWVNLGPFARASVFICHATGGRCEDWDPRKGSNKVILHRVADEALYDGPPTVRVYRRLALTAGESFDELELMRAVKEEALPMRDALLSLRHDKLGGGAVWQTGDATPQSRTGRGPMRLLLQVTTDLIPFDITPKGLGYVFFDPHAEDGDAVLLWQSG